MERRAPTRGTGVLEGFLARRRVSVANRLIPESCRDGRLLDLGCGTRPYFLLNTRFREKYGLDKLAGAEGGDSLRPDGIRLMRFDLEREERLPFRTDDVDVVTMLAVFEHIAPGRLGGLIREIHRVLKPGGRYVATVPAAWADRLLRVMAKWNLVSAEEIDDHKDVYDRRKIMGILERAGFERGKMASGRFEVLANIWVVAVK